MKTYKHLIEYTLSDENIDTALKDAIKGKRDNPEVIDLIEHKDEVKVKIKEDILNKKLKPIIHRAWLRREGYKDRIICRPSLNRARPELWLQHIAVRGVYDVLMTGAYFLSCGSIIGKGVHFGKKHLEKFIRKHPKDCRYCLQIDIKKYYQNINTNMLKYKLEKKIKDNDVLYLLYYLIDNNIAIMNNGTILSGGLPIGAYSSQILGNFYLQDFDHYVKEKLKAKFYMRNMDDMVILGSNKRELHKMFGSISEYLNTLGLTVKPNWQVYKFEYTDKNSKKHGRFIDYLGFKFYRTKTTIRKRIFYKACRVLKSIIIYGLNLTKACRVIAYKGWFDDTDTHYAFREYTNVVSITKCKKLISKGAKNGNKILQFPVKRKTA